MAICFYSCCCCSCYCYGCCCSGCCWCSPRYCCFFFPRRWKCRRLPSIFACARALPRPALRPPLRFFSFPALRPRRRMRVFAPTFAFLCRPPRLAFAVLAFPSLAFPSLAAFLAASVVLAFWRWLVMHARFPFSRPLRAIIERCLGTVAAIAAPIDSTAIRVPLDSTSVLLPMDTTAIRVP